MTQAHESEFYFFRGRVAEHAILQALGVGRGNEVAIQAFNCVAVPAPILVLGARPVYLDIDAATYNIDPRQMERRLTSRTKAIIVQHTFGIPADLDEITEIARRRGIAVIEDCCHALGSRFRNTVVGSFGDAAFYSHRWGKPIVVGAGGLGVVRGELLSERFQEVCLATQPTPAMKTVQVLLEYIGHEVILRPSMFWTVRDLFRKLSRRGLVMPTFDEKELRGLMVDAGWRIPELHRRRLPGQKRTDTEIEFRRRVAGQYAKALSALGARTFSLDERFDPVLLRYPFLVEDRDAVIGEARKRRVELGDWFNSAVHPLSRPEDLRQIGYEMGSCPVAEAVSRRIVTLPIDHKIRSSYVAKTIDFLEHIARLGLLGPARSPRAHAVA